MSPSSLLRFAPISLLLAGCPSGNSLVGGRSPGAVDATVSGDRGSTSDVPAGADLPVGADVPDGGAAAPSITQLIPPGGGTITLNPGGGAPQVTLTFPPGAVRTATPITVTQLMTPPPPGFTPVSPLYRFEPAGLSFGTSVQVSFAFTRPTDLAFMDILWSPNSGSFVSVGGRPATNLIVGNVHHFSTGFVGRADGDGGFPGCDEGYIPCEGECTDVLFDEAHCGSCGESCTGSDLCFEGRCYATTCAGSSADCDGNAASGCETDTQVDSANCGACGVTCDAGTCEAGVCTP